MSFERLETLIGNQAINKLQNSTVAIIGLGGVGAVSAITLARSGIGNLLILDYDIVSESNINRQLIANHKTIGKRKTDVLYDEIKNINPNCNVIKLNEVFNEDSSLFNYDFTYLIDAIDQIESKFLLIKTCLKHNIKFISAMGAARKMDSTKLLITEINKTTHDKIAKILRKKLRNEFIYDRIIVASSTEEVIETSDLGSYMPVTASMGLLLADYVIKKIIME